MIVGHQEPESGGATRTVRSGQQNNEACLIGGVVGLAQFVGTGTFAGAAPSTQGPVPSAAAAAGPAVSAAGPPQQGGRVESYPEPMATGAALLLETGGDAPAQPFDSYASPATANTEAVGAKPPAFAADVSAGSVAPPSAPMGSVPTWGSASAGSSGEVPADSAAPPGAQEVAASLIPASFIQAAVLPASLLQAPALEGSLSQLNISASDHVAAAFSTATTYIEAIYNSIVFLGDNIAVASALNYAPLSQLNLLGGFAGTTGGGAQLTNLAHTDNDATAVAVAGTWINHAYNSIIVTGDTVAAATSTNLAPAKQVNAALFSDSDGSFGSLHEANFLLGDNDSTALAQAGLILGNAMGAGSGGVSAVPLANSFVSTDSPTDHLDWGDLDLV